MKKSTIGGQGVMDGVMMRSKDIGALAVRKNSGEIVTKTWPIKKRKGSFFKWPIVRGVFSFVDMLAGGVLVLSDAANMAGYDEEDYAPNKFEKYLSKKTGKKAEDIMMFFAVVIAICLAVALFYILPTFLTGLLRGSIKSSFLVNLIDGCIRLAIFLLYMVAVSLIPDIKKVYQYHGAEHKTIACYEQEEELTPENVRKYKRLHPRCGTSYLLIVMTITMIIYSFFGWSDNLFLRMGLRLLMLPLIAGISYEVLHILGKSETLFARILRWPGLQLQRLTTAEPNERMIQVAIIAFELALGEKSPAEIEQMRARFGGEKPETENRTDEPT